MSSVRILERQHLTWSIVDRIVGVLVGLICGWVIPFMFLFDPPDPGDWERMLAWRDCQISLLCVLHLIFGVIARSKSHLPLDGTIHTLEQPSSPWFAAGFVLRVIVAIPFFALFWGTMDLENPLLFLVKLLTLAHLSALFDPDELDWILGPIQARLFSLTLIVPLAIHMAAIGWLGLGGGRDPNLPRGPIDFEVYTRAVYWSTSTLATVGYGDITAKTVPQMWYSMLIEIIGVGFFGFVITNIFSVLSKLDAARFRRTEWQERVEAFLAYHKLPSYIRRRVVAYNRYLWETRRGYQDSELLDSLPMGLKTQILLHIHGSGLAQVPLFRDAGPELLRDLVLELKPMLACPGEEIFKAGDKAEAMYFIERGMIEIINSSGETIVKLDEGSFFGEMAIYHNRPRSATARAMVYSELYRLDRVSFHRAMAHHPVFAKGIQESITRKEKERGSWTSRPGDPESIE